MKRYKILFVVPTFYGHVAPSLTIAKHLMADGHIIGYCTGAPAKQILSKARIEYFYPRNAYNTAIMDKDSSLVKWWYQATYRAPNIFSSDVMKRCFNELISSFESFKPDVLYVDTYDIFGLVVAEKYNLPYAHGSATTILYPEKDIPPFSTGWHLESKILNRLRWYPYLLFINFCAIRWYLNERRALQTIDPSWKRKNLSFISPYLYLYFTTDKVEYPRNLFIPQQFYVGPSILEPDKDQVPDFPWEKLDDNRPLIYIATGTVFHEPYKEFYKNAVTALSEKNFQIPVQVVMAMGKQEHIDKLGEIPPNFIVVPYAPQIKLLPKASVVISHGGVNSVNETLMHGKPLLIVHYGGDRIDMGLRISRIGAGKCFDVDKATPKRIRDAVSILLKNPKYKRTSEAIMHDFKKYDAPRTSADLILRLADTRKPVLRKKGAPITLKSIRDLPDYLDLQQY